MVATPDGGRSGRRGLVLGVVAVGISLVILELGTRLVFAPKVGARIFFYGLVDDRDVRGEAIPLPFRWDEKVAVDDPEQAIHATAGARYSKYHPNQELVLQLHGQDYSPRINNFGFRGGDFSRDKPQNAVRIIALGASSTFGYHDRDDETYPHYLEQDLAAEADRRGLDARFEVYNFGIPHLDSDGIRSLFESEALALDPDIVTFYEGVNDTRRIERRPEQRVLIAASRYSLFLRFVQYVLTAQLESFSAEDVRYHAEGRGPHFVENLERIAEACAARGILFFVVSQQAQSKMVAAADIDRVSLAEEISLVREHVEGGNRLGLFGLQLLVYAEIDRHLREWVVSSAAQASGVHFVDMVARFDRAGMRHALVSWVHLSPEGNRFLAQQLSGEILKAWSEAAGPAQQRDG